MKTNETNMRVLHRGINITSLEVLAAENLSFSNCFAFFMDHISRCLAVSDTGEEGGSFEFGF